MPLLIPSYSDAYWTGEPVGYTSPILYGSARGGLVATPEDAAYQAWLEKGYTAWPWPKDEFGAVTTTALDAALAVCGLPATGLTPPTTAQLIAYANAKQWALATGGYTVTLTPVGGSATALLWATDPISQALVTGKAVRLQQTGAPTSTVWQFPTGFETLAAADFIAVAMQIADFVQATFTALEPVLAAIAAGTITAAAQIDAAAWPPAVSTTAAP